MKCHSCHRAINRGTEYQKMIGEYKQPDGSIKIYGFSQEAGPINKAKGQIYHLYHFKCFQVALKREGRGGDAVTGRGMGSIPTAYEIGYMTMNEDDLKAQGLTEEEAKKYTTSTLEKQWNEQNEMGIRLGKFADSWDVKEALRAKGKGALIEREDGSLGSSGYEHKHTKPIEDFHLRAHLHFAHGIEMPESTPRSELRTRHDEDHARLALEKTRASRASDPSTSDENNRIERAWPAAEPTEMEI